MESLNIRTCKLHDYVGKGPCGLCNQDICESCDQLCQFPFKDDNRCRDCIESANEAAYDRYMDRQVSGGIDYAHQQARAKAVK